MINNQPQDEAAAGPSAPRRDRRLRVSAYRSRADWSTRGYDGSVSHNVKAIYQRSWELATTW
jgi:hypothetical protein